MITCPYIPRLREWSFLLFLLSLLPCFLFFLLLLFPLSPPTPVYLSPPLPSSSFSFFSSFYFFFVFFFSFSSCSLCLLLLLFIFPLLFRLLQFLVLNALHHPSLFRLRFFLIFLSRSTSSSSPLSSSLLLFWLLHLGLFLLLLACSPPALRLFLLLLLLSPILLLVSSYFIYLLPPLLLLHLNAAIQGPKATVQPVVSAMGPNTFYLLLLPSSLLHLPLFGNRRLPVSFARLFAHQMIDLSSPMTNSYSCYHISDERSFTFSWISFKSTRGFRYNNCNYHQ